MISSFLRTVFLYLLLVTVVRILGKRQLGEMEPAEFVVTMMAANLSTAPIEDPGSPLIYGLLAILTILGTELSLSTLTMRSLTARRLLCGRPVILIENGRLLQENLRRTRVTLDELMSQLREKDVLDLTTVQYAILETNGGLSVFPFSKDRPATAQEAGLCPRQNFLPVTLVEDGMLLEENLQKVGKELSWLEGVLRDRGVSREEVLLLMWTGQTTLYILKRRRSHETGQLRSGPSGRAFLPVSHRGQIRPAGSDTGCGIYGTGFPDGFKRRYRKNSRSDRSGQGGMGGVETEIQQSYPTAGGMGDRQTLGRGGGLPDSRGDCSLQRSLRRA